MTKALKKSEDSFHLKTYKPYPFTLVRGEDVWVYTSTGEKYLDLYGGHAVVSTGHCHPKLVDAIQKQASSLIFYSNLASIDVRDRALAAFSAISPPGLSRAFFVNSGAEANDNAIKLARRHSNKPGVLSFEGGFHGRTVGTLSATGIQKYRDAFPTKVADHFFLPFGDLAAVETLMKKESIGAILLEPIQSMAGVCMAESSYYTGLRKICDEHNALLIFDEIQTGFGRTGDFFFAPRFGVQPDIITLAKGIASGIPMSAILVSEAIAERVHYGDLGTTFGGGPIACAALEATINILREENLLENVRKQSSYLFEQLRQINGVEETLGLGFLIGIRFQQRAADVQKRLLQHHILTGLSNDPHVMRLLPPLTLQRKEIDSFLEILKKVL